MTADISIETDVDSLILDTWRNEMTSKSVLLFLCFGLAVAVLSCGGGSRPNVAEFIINYPMPAIASLNPNSRTVGGVAFTLTINGSNFVPSSEIYWNGTKYETTFVNASRLTTIIDPQRIVRAGTASIQVSNPSPSGGLSNAMAFTINSNANNWTFLGAPNIAGVNYNAVEHIIVDSEDPKILYVLVHNVGLFATRNGGASWDLAVSGTPPFGHFLEKDQNSINRIFYGQKNRLYISNDRGLSWNLLATLNVASDQNVIGPVTTSALDPHKIYVCVGGKDGSFYRSSDDGAHWENFSFGQTIGMDNFIPWSIAEDPQDGVLYVGVELGSHPAPYRPPFLRSTDGGKTWENIVEKTSSNADGPLWHVISIAVHPTNHKIYALTEGDGLYISPDHGATWTRIVAMNESIIMDPNYNYRFFGTSTMLGGGVGGVYFSTDDAINFYSFGLLGYAVPRLGISSDSKFLFASVFGQGIFYTPIQ
jgi:photosystem II stability/assembly factor-like uncharacterized protein